ncbi:hypothetical protein [Sphingobacterium chungjuense]|uniref:hypothetical protein n=1 Tax=Sphingobacterium chungjuense TaxID=2675553 RepID=UPI00140D43A4|nr:hypothetical protein [Sphingobacterium chungjuense]
MKRFYQTRWEITPDRIVLYPQRTFSMIAIFLLIMGIGLFVLLYNQDENLKSLWPIALIWLLFTIFFGASARNCIVFDNQSGTLYHKWLGVLTTRSIPFNELHSINVVSQSGLGGYSYKLFRKKARYGRGIAVSSGYSKANDENALAFVTEVIPKIHAFFDQHDKLSNPEIVPLTSLRYFRQDGDQYVVRGAKLSHVLYGLLFITMSIWIALGVPEKTIGIHIAQVFVLLLVVVFVNSVFIKFIFDPQQRTLKRTALFSYMNKEYSFEHFLGVQAVRHTTNMIYTGTSVHLHFVDVSKNNKAIELEVASYYRVKNVDRFIQEFHQVMQVQHPLPSIEEQI